MKLVTNGRLITRDSENRGYYEHGAVAYEGSKIAAVGEESILRAKYPDAEVIDARGTFVGGVIAPGLALGARSLSAAAARLPQVEPSAPTHVIGRNTREAMRSGVVLGEVARIDGMLDMVLAEMRATKAAGEGDVPIVITGDDAEALASLVGHSLTVDDALTLRGLAELYRINQKPRRV